MNTTHHITTTISQRLIACAGVIVLFAVFFALPLYAAVNLCTMPCCHHDGSSEQPAVGAGMSGCASDCSISADAATAAESIRSVAPARRGLEHAIAATQVVAAITTASDGVPPVRDEARPRSSSAAPLHVLNSLFRI